MSSMARNVGYTRVDETIKVLCVDNGRSIDAQLISRYPDRIVVELPGGIRLTLRQHHVQKRVYVASHSGMEFQCSLKV